MHVQANASMPWRLGTNPEPRDVLWTKPTLSTLSMAIVVVVSSERPTVRSLRFIRSNQRATEQSNGSYSRRTPLLARPAFAQLRFVINDTTTNPKADQASNRV